MDELFRFLMLRPATPVAANDVKQLNATFVSPGTSRPAAQRAAHAFVAGSAWLPSGDSLVYGKVAAAVAAHLSVTPRAAADVSALVKQVTGKTPADVAADPVFGGEEARIADSLVAMKLLSDSSGGDAPALAVLARGYDAIRLAATGHNPVALRALTIERFPSSTDTPPPKDAPPPTPAPIPSPAPGKSTLSALKEAIDQLGRVPASAFQVTKEALAGAGNGAPAPAAEVSPPPIGRGQGTPPWLMSDAAIAALPATVSDTLKREGLDLHTQPLPVVLDALHTLRVDQLAILAQADISRARDIVKVGNSFGTIAPNDYVGSPSGSLPTTPGSIRPVGIGDLLMVKQHVIRYEGGDLAHVENVLKSEHLSRDTRRLERTETTVLQETETTKEETQDTQTTDRFSLKRETSDTIKTDSSFKAGVSVDAKYGPFVEVKANADFATSTSDQSSVQQASEFSKDVVARSTSKLVERVLERRSVTTITEFEEKYSHGFDNTAGSGHISGFYQWIDKVMQAQIYNYGKRLLFDVTVPEPGTNFILAQTQVNNAAEPLQKPPVFTPTASQLDEGNYLIWAKLYDATGLEPPPPPVKTVAKNIDAVLPQSPYESSKSDTLAIDDGYRARYALFAYDIWFHSNARWGMLIGNNWMNVVAAPRSYLDMAGEVGSVAFAYEAIQVEAMAATIEIFCERTERAFAAWQLKVHAGITQAYLAKQQAYEQALAQAQAAAGTVIAGRNPDFNTRLVASELRRQCLTLVTAQQFDAFGALELSAEGYAQPNIDRTLAQMPYVRFFEQAFEWERIVYFFYPYFWGWKKAWKNHMLLDDTDPAFGDFLRAGAARVVFPVRPGFEAAVVHYLESGEIWNGGPPPDISSSLYLPIVQEIVEATGAPGNEQPVGDPWEVRLPTTLVRIRPHDDLPTWQKVGEVWQATN